MEVMPFDMTVKLPDNALNSSSSGLAIVPEASIF